VEERADFRSRTGNLFIVLAGVMGAFAFWSTALAEVAGILLVVIGAAGIFSPGGWPVHLPDGLIVPRAALLLALIYTGAVCVSVVASGSPVSAHAGLLWHPLLFPAALLVPREGRVLRRAGILFLASGASASAFTLTMNALRHHQGAPLLLTGLTTFADLLVLAGAVACAFIVQSEMQVAAYISFVLPLLLIAAGLLWSAERAPVIVFGAVGSLRFARAGPWFLAAWVIVALACLLLSPPALTEKLGWIVRGNPIDRYLVWEEGLRLAPRSPLFGFGPGSYESVLPADTRDRFMNRAPSSWHNDMLETWLDSGPVAGVAFGGLLLCGVLYGFRGALGRAKGGFSRPGGEPGSLFLALAAFGLVGSVVTTSVLGLAFWLLLGLTLNPRAAENLPEAPRSF
jgi:hypothetical protein